MENINIGQIHSEEDLERAFKDTVIEYMEKIREDCTPIEGEGKLIKSEIDIARYTEYQENTIAEKNKKVELDNKRKERKKERIDQRKNQKKMKKSVKRKKRSKK